MIWLLGLGALLLFPLFSALVPPLPLPIVPEMLAAPAPTPAPFALPADAVSGAPAVTTSAAPVASLGLGDLVELLYLAVAVGLLGRLALGHYLLARLWRGARPVPDGRWADLLGGLRRSLGIRRPVALRIAAGPAMPMTWGTLKPRILLPAEALAWTDERRRIVLLHELAHISRQDA